jgi:glutamine amidotransferase PdxT
VGSCAGLLLLLEEEDEDCAGAVADSTKPMLRIAVARSSFGH